MSSGYIRQSTSGIVNADTIQASDLNNEYNALQTAFDNTAGHTHDGSSTGVGAPIPLAGLANLAGLSVIGNSGTSSAAPAAITGTAGQVMLVNAGGTALGFGSVSLTATVTGILPVANGGTNAATAAATTVFAGPTSGSAAAPAFRALVGTDLPNPGASTLGGVQSYAAVTNQWINAVSTSGVHSSSQPAFTNLSGILGTTQMVALTGDVTNTGGAVATTISANAITNAKLATMASDTIKANITGGSAVPTDATLTAILDTISGTEGVILYRGASAWTALSPGTSGQYLQTQGASAIPQWNSVTGTGGTVTSIATNNGVTGGTITGSGTIGLAAITAGTVLANTTGSGAVPVGNTISAILDNGIASTQGDITYRGASSWSALSPGSNGQILQTQGAAANPQWVGLSAAIDTALGSTQGDILFRGASVWAVLAPGTAGQLLQSGGASANPSWTSTTFATAYGAVGTYVLQKTTVFSGSTTGGSTGTLTGLSGTWRIMGFETLPGCCVPAPALFLRLS